MHDLLDRLIRAKLGLIGVGLTFTGIAVVAIIHSLPVNAQNSLPAELIKDLGVGTFTAGLLGVLLQYFTDKDTEARATKRFDRVLESRAATIRDTVYQGFAFDPAELQTIASTDTLDRLARNALAVRLGDADLAADAYKDLRDQVIRAPERWHDVDISVSLAPWEKGPATGRGSMFVATIRWEYRVDPTSATMRFACVSDLDEYRELLRDQSVTSAWHFDPSAGIDASDKAVFELLQLMVNGEARKVRRTQRTGSQVYSASLGTAGTSGEVVTVAYTYRVLVQRHGHLLYIDLPRPTKGLHVQLDYASAGIRRVNTLDFIASSEDTRIDETPASVPARTVDIGFDGWIFPRSGVAFVWVLEDELTPTSPRRKSK